MFAVATRPTNPPAPSPAVFALCYCKSQTIVWTSNSRMTLTEGVKRMKVNELRTTANALA
jgi:hypothetical protein